MRTKAIFAAAAVTILCVANANAQTDEGVHWPMFRGPQALGIAEDGATPTKWDVESGENVKWKTAIPGLGHASPVIWGDRVFVVSAISSGQKDPYLKVGLYGNIDPVDDPSVHQWMLYCLDKSSGKIVWEKLAYEGVPRIKRHTKSSHASSTPATNGKYLVTFLGSEGLFCFDFEGNLVWRKDLGTLDAGFFRVPEAQWGFASSPMIYDNKVLVQCDVQENSFIAAFDLETGREIWRTAREEVPTWSTPMVHVSDDRAQVIANGWKHIGGYDLETGEPLWWMRGGGDIPVPVPIVAHDLIYITNAHGGQAPIYAIRTDATGDITLENGATSNAGVAWSEARTGAYMVSPLVYGDELYILKNNGVLTCFDAKSGERHYQMRLGSGQTGFTASPVAANGVIYFSGEYGEIFMVKAGPEFELLGGNEMHEICMATPAISEGALFFRTRGHLVAIGE
ncbi:PQQ-binding-like beta-propeller repeat protein [candidate division KSB1 bacterium]|nr:PQQ-binding-like beta-propeller repeat protein [candidate division KSB1 bacterium]